MLKIYLQIFGTIALCVILWFNYSVFVQKPMKAQIAASQEEVKKLQAQNAILESILEFKPYFSKLEQLHVNDYKDANIFFARTFNEPRFMGRIQKMVDLAGCETDGIKVGKITSGKKISTYEQNFMTAAKDQKALQASVQAFIETMGKYTKDSKMWQSVAGPDSHYANRLMFYRELGGGKKYPGSTMGGFDIHRFQLTVKGSYNNCKKFLWLVNQNRPFTQVYVQSFTPITKGIGTDKIFAVRVTVFTYMDKNGPMVSSLLTSTPAQAPDVTKTATPETKTTEGTTQATPTAPKTETAKPLVSVEAPSAKSKSGK